ncbi:MAG: aminopeptidase P family N-terminal domain-containing protein [Spirochaetaceae bacterium]|nr:MAG: aminopeptidase P family N-terminal domain-containing protein [Spirochaetaceae bacterium]
MFVQEEIQEKKRRIRALLEELKLNGIYLKRQSNFSWLTGGGSNVVGITVELGVAGLLITSDSEAVICSNIEAQRMEKEEKLEEQGYKIYNFLWYEDREAEIVRELAGGIKLGADYGFPEAEDISGKINALRYSLTPWEVERYREIGHLTSVAIEQTAQEIKPGDKECAVIGRLAERLWEHRLDYVTTFCAADERIAEFRHPIATEKKIGKRAMLCVNSRRQGLIVSLTRFVQFGPVPEEIRRKYDANVLIDCILMAHTVPGKPVVEAFRKGVAAYQQAGYPEEYKLHHQGGAIGYVGRDYKVNFQTKEIVRENQAFAWNPSISGSKSEDTMIATSEGPLLLSKPVLFPDLKVEVGGIEFSRPDILRL